MAFLKDVEQMMYGFGDCSKPIPETVELIHGLVHQQMISVLLQAAEIDCMKNSKPVTPESIIFLMRKKPEKLQRLLNYLSIRDTISQGLITMDDSSSSAESQISRVKLCKDFLESIGREGQYDDVFGGNVPDQVKIERVMRCDSISKNISPNKYTEYCKARRASFCPRLRVGKFREWLIEDDTRDFKLSQYTMEILNFLAYETIAQIVDLSLLVKKDRRGNSSDLSRYQPRAVINTDYPSVQLQQQNFVMPSATSESTGLKFGMDPITTDEVRELIRRWSENSSSLRGLSKIRSPIDKLLLAI